MSIGDHLEELRMRLILALGGLFLVAIVFLTFGERVTAAFCRPLINALQGANVNPQVYFTSISDPFMVYLEISFISAAAVSAPWMVWQIWQFVASGLYPHERRTITKYVPMSISLLIAGMAFVYWVVLPWSLAFFLQFSFSIPLPKSYTPTVSVPATQQVSRIDEFDGDPREPTNGQWWLNRLDGRVKLFVNGQVRTLTFGPENLTAPIITLPGYIDLVMNMLLTFGLAFQMPLVVMALVATGLVELSLLKKSRKVVYFGLSIFSAFFAPGDVITVMLALLFPLIGLYELGIFMARNLKAAQPTEDEIAQM